MADDKLCILAAMKQVWKDRLTTVFLRQGYYVLDSGAIAACPPANLTIEHKGELATVDVSALMGDADAHRAG